MFGYEFYVDPSRCIACRACENACAECDTHRGVPMIHMEYVDRARSTASVPTVCMHCEEPTCALVCPADAIKQNEEGVVHSSLKPRCIACSSCVLACPFGVPRMMVRIDQMMKCDMCWDRTSVGLRPMCATVCPSQALAYVTPESIAASRREVPRNRFRFGNQEVTTKVFMMVASDDGAAADEIAVDVLDYMDEGAARG